jgi:hypothetical protein
MPRRLWDRVYCCPTAAKAPDVNVGGFSFFPGFAGRKESRRADSNRLPLLITSLLAYILARTGASGFRLVYASFGGSGA